MKVLFTIITAALLSLAIISYLPTTEHPSVKKFEYSRSFTPSITGSLSMIASTSNTKKIFAKAKHPSIKTLHYPDASIPSMTGSLSMIASASHIQQTHELIEKPVKNLSEDTQLAQTSAPNTKTVLLSNASWNMKFNHLASKAPALKKNVLRLALTAYQNAFHKGDVKKPLLTVIDYSLPSNKQRMWVFDLTQEKLLYNTYVAHGKNSGNDVAKHFSNQSSSKESSLGTYVTRDTYYGSKGLSLNLKGLEKGFNDNAYNRRVVMHGAWYVEPSFIKSSGRAGRSWGCPSIAKTLAKPIINTLKGGSVIFAYYPDRNYLSHSHFLTA